MNNINAISLLDEQAASYIEVEGDNGTIDGVFCLNEDSLNEFYVTPENSDGIDKNAYIEVSMYDDYSGKRVSKKFDFGTFLKKLNDTIITLASHIGKTYMSKTEADQSYVPLSGTSQERPITGTLKFTNDFDENKDAIVTKGRIFSGSVDTGILSANNKIIADNSSTFIALGSVLLSTSSHIRSESEDIIFSYLTANLSTLKNTNIEYGDVVKELSAHGGIRLIGNGRLYVGDNNSSYVGRSDDDRVYISHGSILDLSSKTISVNTILANNVRSPDIRGTDDSFTALDAGIVYNSQHQGLYLTNKIAELTAKAACWS